MRKSESIKLSLDPWTKNKLQAYAAQRCKSVSQCVTDWIRDEDVDGYDRERTEMEEK